MINTDMRLYNYYLYGTLDEYGQPQLSQEIQGQIKLCVNTTNQSTVDNIKYKDATYIGLTLAPIDDKYVVEYGDELLKVMYVNPKGRYKQAFLKNVN